jgi:hypothetical protein
VIAPPGADPEPGSDRVWAHFAEAFQLLSGREMSPGEAEARRSRIEVVPAADPAAHGSIRRRPMKSAKTSDIREQSVSTRPSASVMLGP